MIRVLLCHRDAKRSKITVVEMVRLDCSENVLTLLANGCSSATLTLYGFDLAASTKTELDLNYTVLMYAN